MIPMYWQLRKLAGQIYAWANLRKRRPSLSFVNYLEMWRADGLVETALHMQRYFVSQSVAQLAAQVIKPIEMRFF